MRSAVGIVRVAEASDRGKITRMRLFVLVFGLAALLSAAGAAEYKLTPPPAAVMADLEVEFSVFSTEEIQLEVLPDHPRIVWLSEDLEVGEEPGATMFVPGPFGSVQSAITDLENGEHRATFSFVALGKGNLTPPPIPIFIGGERILLRLPKMKVVENLHAGLTEMITMWNGEPEKPKSLRIGQTVDLEILSITPAEGILPWQVVPKMIMNPVRWYRATVPYPKASPDLRFIRFGRRIFERDELEFRDRMSHVQRYKTRFTVLPGDRLHGAVGMTLTDGLGQVTHHTSIDVPVAPMPPMPAGSYVSTGLIGDCTFAAYFDPPDPSSDKPFRVTIDIEATGDSQLLEDFDFSRAGFRSIESNQRTAVTSRFDRYRGRFTQTLIADGTASTFPAINLLSFDTPSDSWKIHKVTDTLHFPDLGGVGDAVGPVAFLGGGVQRPILLNLHPATFGALALAPFLPLLAGLLARQRKRRDPLRDERRKKFASLRKRLDAADDAEVPGLLDNEVIPMLRAYVDLPDGASTRELADALEEREHADLAALLREHADAAFGSSADSPASREKLAPMLAKITFGLLFFIGGMSIDAHAETVDEALEAAALDYAEARYESAADRYETLLEKYPNYVSLNLNLARSRLAADQLHGARASAKTAVLLDPMNKEARDVLDSAHRRLGDPPLPGSAFLALRPDQLLTGAVGLWVLGFVFIAVRKFRQGLPRWAVVACFVLAGGLLISALWRNSSAYAPDQYMVVVEELPRESEPGNPSYDYPPLRSGNIVRAKQVADTPSHLYVESGEAAFWVPASKLQKIW